MLDGRLITERRMALRLSRSALAKRVAKSPPVIRLVEEGDNHLHLTLDFIARLAEALAVDPADLLRLGDPERLATAVPHADAAKVEAALTDSRDALRAVELARGLGWSLERVHHALAALGTRLEGTGQMLHQHAGTWRLRSRSAVLSPAEQQRLAGSRIARTRITRYDAEVLRTVALGLATANWVKRGSAARSASLHALIKLGYIEPDGAGYRLTDGVKKGLGLAQAARDDCG